MGVAQSKFQNLACGCGAVTHTDELHFFAIALVHTFNHVVDESAVETVLGAVLAVVARACDVHVIVFYGYFQVRVYLLAEFAVFSFDGHNVVLLINRHCYTGGNCDRCFTNS